MSGVGAAAVRELIVSTVRFMAESRLELTNLVAGPLGYCQQER
jgi:hypothetical protein